MNLTRRCGVYGLTLFMLIMSHVAQAQVEALSVDQEQAKTQLIQAWLNYFQSLHTLEYKSTSVMDRHPIKPLEGKIYTLNFLLDGGNFRTTLTFPPKYTERSQEVSCFDGTSYQSLDIYRSGQSRLIYDTTPIFNAPYNLETFPLLAFNFAFSPDDMQTISFLQNPVAWQNVRQRIIQVEAGKWKEYQGEYVTIKAAAPNDIAYKIFVEGKTFFPLSFVTTSQFISRMGAVVTEIGEGEITETTTWRVGDQTFLFPLKSSAHITRDVEVFISGTDAIIGPVQINGPAPEKSVFTIPHTQATHVIDRKEQKRQFLEEQDRILQEGEPARDPVKT